RRRTAPGLEGDGDPRRDGHRPRPAHVEPPLVPVVPLHPHFPETGYPAQEPHIRPAAPSRRPAALAPFFVDRCHLPEGVAGVNPLGPPARKLRVGGKTQPPVRRLPLDPGPPAHAVSAGGCLQRCIQAPPRVPDASLPRDGGLALGFQFPRRAGVPRPALARGNAVADLNLLRSGKLIAYRREPLP